MSTRRSAERGGGGGGEGTGLSETKGPSHRKQAEESLKGSERRLGEEGPSLQTVRSETAGGDKDGTKGVIDGDAVDGRLRTVLSTASGTTPKSSFVSRSDGNHPQQDSTVMSPSRRPPPPPPLSSSPSSLLHRPCSPRHASSRDQGEGAGQTDSETPSVPNGESRKKRRRHRFRRHLRGGGGEAESKSHYRKSSDSHYSHQHPHPGVYTASSRSVFPSPPCPLVLLSTRQTPEISSSSFATSKVDSVREGNDVKKAAEEPPGLPERRRDSFKEGRRDSLTSGSSSASKGRRGKLSRKLGGKRRGKEKISKEKEVADVLLHHVVSGVCTPEDPRVDRHRLHHDHEYASSLWTTDDGGLKENRPFRERPVLDPSLESFLPYEKKQEKHQDTMAPVLNHGEGGRASDFENEENRRRDSFYSVPDISEGNFREFSFSQTEAPPPVTRSDEWQKKGSLSLTPKNSMPTAQPCSGVRTAEKGDGRMHVFSSSSSLSPSPSPLDGISCRLQNHTGPPTTPIVEKTGVLQDHGRRQNDPLRLSPSSSLHQTGQHASQDHDDAFRPSVGLAVDIAKNQVGDQEEEEELGAGEGDSRHALLQPGTSSVENFLETMLGIKQERQRTGSTTSSALHKRVPDREEETSRGVQGGQEKNVVSPSSSDDFPSISRHHSPTSTNTEDKKTSKDSDAFLIAGGGRNLSSLESLCSSSPLRLQPTEAAVITGETSACSQVQGDRKKDEEDRRPCLYAEQAERKLEGQESFSLQSHTNAANHETRPPDDKEKGEARDEEDAEEEEDDDEEYTEEENTEVEVEEDGEGSGIVRRRRSSGRHRWQNKDDGGRDQRGEDFFSQLDSTCGRASEDIIEFVLKALEERRMAFNARQNQAVALHCSKSGGRKKKSSANSPSKPSSKNLRTVREEERDARSSSCNQGSRGGTRGAVGGDEGILRAEEEEEDGWDRQRDLLDLAEFLLDASVVCMAPDLVDDPEKGGGRRRGRGGEQEVPPPASRLQSTKKTPHSGDFPRVYDKDGLSVWKKEFGAGRVLIRGQSTLLCIFFFFSPRPISLDLSVPCGVRVGPMYVCICLCISMYRHWHVHLYVYVTMMCLCRCPGLCRSVC